MKCQITIIDYTYVAMSLEAKKKQAVHDERVSYLQVVLL